MKIIGLTLKKISVTVLTAVLIAMLCFSVMYFSPGNPAAILLRYKNPTGGMNQQTVEMYAEKLGINQNFFVQFGGWVNDAFHGNLGYSFKTGLPVFQEFSDRMGCTFSLMLFATAVSLFVGVLFGVLSALYHRKFLDKIIRIFAVVNMSVPNFWMGILFLWLFAIKLNLLPSFGFNGPASIVLPGTVLGLGHSATIIRISKSCILENMSRCYVTTARAKGLRESAVVIKHVLKNIMLPIITLSGMSLVSIMGGSAIIESIFGLPGIGNYLVTAITVKDFPIIMGFSFLMGLIVVVINLLVDLSYALIDPRVRQGINER